MAQGDHRIQSLLPSLLHLCISGLQTRKFSIGTAANDMNLASYPIDLKFHILALDTPITNLEDAANCPLSTTPVWENSPPTLHYFMKY